MEYRNHYIKCITATKLSRIVKYIRRLWQFGNCFIDNIHIVKKVGFSHFTVFIHYKATEEIQLPDENDKHAQRNRNRRVFFKYNTNPLKSSLTTGTVIIIVTRSGSFCF